MANKDYYYRWLDIKEQFKLLLNEDANLQNLAINRIGLKPQKTAVETVARVYCAYCELYNKLCDCYDQMEQVQRRPFLKSIIDAVTCRLIELKTTLEEVECIEFTCPENSLQQLLMIPQEIEILCPFHYPFEIRQKENQTIIDEIFAGKRLGDAFKRQKKTNKDDKLHEGEEKENVSENENENETGNENENKNGNENGNENENENEKEDEKDNEKEKEASVSSISQSVESEIPREMIYNSHLINIQRMERSRYIVRRNTSKFNKDTDLYLELAGLKGPQAKQSLRTKAATYIQNLYRRFMQLKREHYKEKALKLKLGMVFPSWSPPSAKIQLEKVKEVRREFRRKYYEEWCEKNIKEHSRVIRLREDDTMEDITDEIRQWFREWYKEVYQFDEYPWPLEGGSILIVRGETFTIEEYVEWRNAELKRLAQESGNPKSKQQIKEEKRAAKEEAKRLEMEAKKKEEKRIADYKKQRLNPANDPGVFVKIGKHLQPIDDAWFQYESQWRDMETPHNVDNILKGYIMELITQSAYTDLQFKVRPVVDEMMRLELSMLRKALKEDYRNVGIYKLPLTKKRKKPKVPKPKKPDKIPPVVMFQSLVDEGIIRKYPHVTLNDYWGDKNYAAADTRGILWTPKFPPPCLGDVIEQVRIRCLLTLGSECPDACRTQLLVGSKCSGKETLAYAIATETNSILIDLSPFNVYNKYPGKKWKTMLRYIKVISKEMEPTVIFIADAEKIFYKKVPPLEKPFNPQRMSKDLFKQIIRPLNGTRSKILVIGTASQPWLAKKPKLFKAFPSVIMMPRSDYASISFILTRVLMKYHALDREFDVHSCAQVLRGFDINTIRKAIESLLCPKRITELQHTPLKPMELIDTILNIEDRVETTEEDYDMFTQWYLGYSNAGRRYTEYMIMLESQYRYYLKNETKKKG